jgi:hypothetical protein
LSITVPNDPAVQLGFFKLSCHFAPKCGGFFSLDGQTFANQLDSLLVELEGKKPLYPNNDIIKV